MLTLTRKGVRLGDPLWPAAHGRQRPPLLLARLHQVRQTVAEPSQSALGAIGIRPFPGIAVDSAAAITVLPRGSILGRRAQDCSISADFSNALLPCVWGGLNSGHGAEQKPATAAVTGRERVPPKPLYRTSV